MAHVFSCFHCGCGLIVFIIPGCLYHFQYLSWRRFLALVAALHLVPFGTETQILLAHSDGGVQQTHRTGCDLGNSRALAVDLKYLDVLCGISSES